MCVCVDVIEYTFRWLVFSLTSVKIRDTLYVNISSVALIRRWLYANMNIITLAMVKISNYILKVFNLLQKNACISLYYRHGPILGRYTRWLSAENITWFKPSICFSINVLPVHPIVFKNMVLTKQKRCKAICDWHSDFTSCERSRTGRRRN